MMLGLRHFLARSMPDKSRLSQYSKNKIELSIRYFGGGSIPLKSAIQLDIGAYDIITPEAGMDDLSNFCCRNESCSRDGQWDIDNLTVCGHSLLPSRSTAIWRRSGQTMTDPSLKITATASLLDGGTP